MVSFMIRKNKFYKLTFFNNFKAVIVLLYCWILIIIKNFIQFLKWIFYQWINTKILGAQLWNQNIPTGDSDVGDIVMLVTLWWWLIWDVGGGIIMLEIFFVMLVFFRCIKSVTNISDLSPTHLVSNIRHQYPSNRFNVHGEFII